jgi:hypothetical protein
LGDLKKELKMKNNLVKILKKISEGSLNSGGTIAIAVILGALVVVAFALIPMLLIWGLQLMGIGITTSFKSYIGSLLILTYLSYSRIGSGKESKED